MIIILKEIYTSELRLENALRVLAERLRAEGNLDPGERFIDGSFAAAKMGASRWQNQAHLVNLKNFGESPEKYQDFPQIWTIGLRKAL